eukprot:13422809-Alexandrium_andersonii.AAC.1
MRTWPTCERIVEAQHRYSKQTAGRSKAGPLVASLALRGNHVIEKMVSRSPQAFDELASCLED